MIVYPVKHSPLLRQPEHFIARDELKTLIKKVTHNLVNIHDETGEFLLRLDNGRVIQRIYRGSAAGLSGQCMRCRIPSSAVCNTSR